MSYRNHVVEHVLFEGENRKIAVAETTHLSDTPTGKPSVPIYTVQLLDPVLTEVAENDKIQIVLSDPLEYYELNKFLKEPSDRHRALIAELYKVVEKHHQAFNPENP
ncbi:hypothetical protein ACX0G7_02200 [Flavitalea antarctica]